MPNRILVRNSNNPIIPTLLFHHHSHLTNPQGNFLFLVIIPRTQQDLKYRTSPRFHRNIISLNRPKFSLIILSRQEKILSFTTMKLLIPSTISDIKPIIPKSFSSTAFLTKSPRMSRNSLTFPRNRLL